MALKPPIPNSQLRVAVKEIATSEWKAAVNNTIMQLEHEAPEKVKQVRAVLEEVRGRQLSLTSEKAAKQLTRQGVLSGVPASFIATLHGAAVAKAYKRPLAAALSSAAREDLDAVIRTVVKRKGQKYVPLFERLGGPDTNQWAAWLQRAILWAPKVGEELTGQVRNLAGQLLERLRKVTATFAGGNQGAARVVDAYNESALKKAAASERERLRFDVPKFFEGMTDGDGKLLSDGMYLSFNREGELLISRIEEVKLKSVGADAIPQIDAVIERIHQRGIRLSDGRFFPPGRIVLPVSSMASANNLVAFVEGATLRELSTPKGYRVTVAGVESVQAREFAHDLLTEWHKRLASVKVPH